MSRIWNLSTSPQPALETCISYVGSCEQAYSLYRLDYLGPEYFLTGTLLLFTGIEHLFQATSVLDNEESTTPILPSLIIA